MVLEEARSSVPIADVEAYLGAWVHQLDAKTFETTIRAITGDAAFLRACQDPTQRTHLVHNAIKRYVAYAIHPQPEVRIVCFASPVQT
jgi:hypothetical protein